MVKQKHKILSYIRLMRPHHYLKNLLVFVALGCSGQLFVPGRLAACAAGFAAFSLLSSVVYIVNDIRDREKDRLHPVKCRRPIAAGEISVAAAWTLAGSLFLAAAGVNALVFRPISSAALLGYFLLNLAYSFGLKNVPLADISILAAGFLLRVLYGAAVTGIAVSNWLYLTVIAGSFYFAMGKRRNEQRQLAGRSAENGAAGAPETPWTTRKVLSAYPADFLDKGTAMFLTMLNVFYALWAMDERSAALHDSRPLFLTVPIVLLITLKYSMDIEGDSSGDPVDVLLHDKVLILLCLIYLAAMLLILYL